MLPKIDLPLVPMILPSTGKLIKYRPFTVKEEKIMLMAQESKDAEQITLAIKQIITNCVFGVKNISTLPIFDIEMIMINLRKDSVGGELDVELPCIKCDQYLPVVVDLLKISISHKPKTKIIKVNDQIHVEFGFPTLNSLGIEHIPANTFTLLADTILTVTDGEEIYKGIDISLEEKEVFLMGIPSSLMEECKNHLMNIPKVAYNDKRKCPHCQEENDITVEGLMNFFG